MSHLVLNILRAKLRETRSPSEAVDATIDVIANEVERRLAHESLQVSLTSVGLDAQSAQKVAQLAVAQGVVWALRSVIGGGSAAGVPTAECLSRHLPPGRDPTDDEMDAAIEACRRESAST